MRKLAYAAFAAVLALSLGCAITDYPVIFDDRGPDCSQVMDSFYDKALIDTGSQVATLWSNGSDNLFTQVVQDWKGDQWLYTYNNFDPTLDVLFYNNTYCDPIRLTDCAVTTAWNPDPTFTVTDNWFDYTFDTSCSGAKSLSLLVAYLARARECGSAFQKDPQGFAAEFALLSKVNWHGSEWYHAPIDRTNTDVTFNGDLQRIFGRYDLYINDDFNVALQMTANARYQLRAFQNYVDQNGHEIEVNVNYGSLDATWNIFATSFNLDRF
jgi:hypothetical protein